MLQMLILIEFVRLASQLSVRIKVEKKKRKMGKRNITRARIKCGKMSFEFIIRWALLLPFDKMNYIEV